MHNLLKRYKFRHILLIGVQNGLYSASIMGSCLNTVQDILFIRSKIWNFLRYFPCEGAPFLTFE
jgi:hypothetical protein